MSEHSIIEDWLGDDTSGVEEYFDPHDLLVDADRQQEHYWYLHRRQVILEMLRESMPRPAGRLIELGCGIGTVATYLNQHGYHVDYADMHRQSLEVASSQARARLGPAAVRRFLRMDVFRQDLPAGYEAALLFDVIEHVPDDHDLLRRVRVMFDGADFPGLLMVTVPAFPILWAPWDDTAKHKRRYTPRNLRATIEGAGFVVERLSCFFSPLFVAALTVKGARKARDTVRPARAYEFGELIEGRSIPVLNRGLLWALTLERRWLRRRNLALGTSLICVARATGPLRNAP